MLPGMDFYLQGKSCANNERQLDPTPDRLKEKGFIKTKLKERAKTNMADENTNNTGRSR